MLLVRKIFSSKNFSSIRRLSKITGGEVIFNKLRQKNVTDVFLYSGGAIMPAVDAFYNNSIKYYINTHEQSLGHAATGYLQDLADLI